MIDKIKIGGVDRSIKVRYIDMPIIIKRYNYYYNKACEDFEKEYGKWPDPTDVIIIDNDFFFWTLWLVLDDFEKKKFKKKKNMIRELLKDEYQGMCSFVGDRILGASDEDKKSGNVN